MPAMPKPHLTSIGYWRCRIDGKQHHLGKNKREAFAKFYRLMANAHKVVPREQPTTVGLLVLAYLRFDPGEDHQVRLNSLIDFAIRERLADVGVDFLESYIRYLQTTGYVRRRRTRNGKYRQQRYDYAQTSIKDRMFIARKAMAWAHKQGWIAVIPDMPKLPKAVRKARDISQQSLQDFHNLPDSAGRILRFILFTGCRPSEATRLRWENVDLPRSVCIVYEHKTVGKTGKARTLYLTPLAIEVLESVHRTNPYVFISRHGTPYTTAGLRSILKKHCGCTPYQLRHTFAQRASEQIPENELATLMGHTSPSTTRLYYEIRSERARQAAASLTQTLPSAPPAQSDDQKHVAKRA